MKLHKLLPILLLVLTITMVSCKQGPGKMIAGTWKITDITAKGTVNDSVFHAMKAELLKVEMTFQGNKYTMSSDGKVIESGTYVVDKDKLMLRTDQGMAMDATITKDRLTLDTPDFTAVLIPK